MRKLGSVFFLFASVSAAQVLMTGGKTHLTAGTPSFSPAAGSYGSTQTVTISTVAGGVICYNTTGSPATNGTTGCTTGTLYTGTISVSSTETLYAVAGGTGYYDSAIASAAYTISANPIAIVNNGTPAHTFCSSSGTSCTTTGMNTTGATLFVIATSSYNSAANTPTATSNTFHCLTASGSSGNRYASVCYAYAVTTGISQQFTCGDASGYISCEVSAWKNTLTTSSVYDSTAGVVGNYSTSTTSIQPSASLTPSAANELLIIAFSASNNFSAPNLTIDSGFQVLDTTSGSGELGIDAYLIDSGSSALQPTITYGSGVINGGNNAISMAAFVP